MSYGEKEARLLVYEELGEELPALARLRERRGMRVPSRRVFRSFSDAMLMASDEHQIHEILRWAAAGRPYKLDGEVAAYYWPVWLAYDPACRPSQCWFNAVLIVDSIELAESIVDAIGDESMVADAIRLLATGARRDITRWTAPTPVRAAQLIAGALGHGCGWGGQLVSASSSCEELVDAWEAFSRLWDAVHQPTSGPWPITSWPLTHFESEGKQVARLDWETCTGGTNYLVQQHLLVIETYSKYPDPRMLEWRLEWDVRTRAVSLECWAENVAEELVSEAAYRIIQVDDLLEGHLSELMGRLTTDVGPWWRAAISAAVEEMRQSRFQQLAAEYQDGWG